MRKEGEVPSQGKHLKDILSRLHHPPLSIFININTQLSAYPQKCCYNISHVAVRAVIYY